MGEIFANVILTILYLVWVIIWFAAWGMAIFLYFYAIWQRFMKEDWIMFIIDILVPPISVIDGIGQYFGYW